MNKFSKAIVTSVSAVLVATSISVAFAAQANPADDFLSSSSSSEQAVSSQESSSNPAVISSTTNSQSASSSSSLPKASRFPAKDTYYNSKYDYTNPYDNEDYSSYVKNAHYTRSEVDTIKKIRNQVIETMFSKYPEKGVLFNKGLITFPKKWIGTWYCGNRKIVITKHTIKYGNQKANLMLMRDDNTFTTKYSATDHEVYLAALPYIKPVQSWGAGKFVKTKLADKYIKGKKSTYKKRSLNMIYMDNYWRPYSKISIASVGAPTMIAFMSTRINGRTYNYLSVGAKKFKSTTVSVYNMGNFFKSKSIGKKYANKKLKNEFGIRLKKWNKTLTYKKVFMWGK
ncbi:MAG: hypothetical protein Q3960_00245 [Lactobacillus sp.]|nr:hypothetical protein [Lactobacillus sp.]